jgi:hypothetical protein
MKPHIKSRATRGLIRTENFRCKSEAHYGKPELTKPYHITAGFNKHRYAFFIIALAGTRIESAAVSDPFARNGIKLYVACLNV